MKHFGYKGIGPIVCYNNGVIDPIKAIARRNRDTSSLGFKKIPFHLGINKFILESKNSSRKESHAESNGPKENFDDEDPYPYPIPHDVAKFFANPDDFVPRVNTMDGTSNSSEDTTKSYHTQLE